MQFSFSATGPKTSALATIDEQRARIIAADPEAQVAADAVVTRMRAELATVADTESVTLSATVGVYISKPAASIE